MFEITDDYVGINALFVEPIEVRILRRGKQNIFLFGELHHMPMHPINEHMLKSGPPRNNSTRKVSIAALLEYYTKTGRPFKQLIELSPSIKYVSAYHCALHEICKYDHIKADLRDDIRAEVMESMVFSENNRRYNSLVQRRCYTTHAERLRKYLPSAIAKHIDTLALQTYMSETRRKLPKEDQMDNYHIDLYVFDLTVLAEIYTSECDIIVFSGQTHTRNISDVLTDKCNSRISDITTMIHWVYSVKLPLVEMPRAYANSYHTETHIRRRKRGVKIAFEWDELSWVKLNTENQTPEMCWNAVARNGLALQFVRIHTLEICLLAIDNTEAAKRYINDPELRRVIRKYA